MYNVPQLDTLPSSRRFLLFMYAVIAGLSMGATISFAVIVPRGVVSVLICLLETVLFLALFRYVWRTKD